MPLSYNDASSRLLKAHIGTDTIVRKIERLFAMAAAIGIFLLMSIGITQIVGRQVFNTPIFGYIDIVELLMAPFAFFAISYAERAGDHVRMTLLVNRLRGRWLYAMQLIGALIGLFVIATLIRYGFDHALRAYTSGDVTIDARYLWWPSKLVVPISLSLLWARLLVMTIGFIGLLIRPAPEPFYLSLQNLSGMHKTQNPNDEIYDPRGD
ncbi:MAG: TRAP transporter small permease [Parvularculales bacterium]